MAMPMRLGRRRTPVLRKANLARLEKLAGALASRGMAASPVAPPCRMPRLEVTHPCGAAHDVYAWRGQDGTWWYWWPWAQPIAPDGDLDTAASAIEHVLGGPAGRPAAGA